MTQQQRNRIGTGRGRAGNYVAACAMALFLCAPAAALAQISDDFERPDASALGNGWIEKTPAALSLSGGTVLKQSTATTFRDNLAYRPVAEDRRDVQASVELNLTDAGSPGFPQVLVRVQRATVAIADTLDAYILYINDFNAEANLSRLIDGRLTRLRSISLAPAMNTSDTYRLRLSAVGANPVELAAFVERWSGSAWTSIGQATYVDTYFERLDGGGSVGFGGNRGANYRYDNFLSLDLGVPPNPMPTAGTLAPDRASAGGGAFTLTLDGANFVDGAVVQWDGANRTTTFVSDTRLTAAISATDVATPGGFDVTAVNPAPGGGTSNALSFTVDADNPLPAISSLDPTSVVAGEPAFTLNVTGTGFVPASTVQWDGAARTTTFVSPTLLQASIGDADIADAVDGSVTVLNPAPGGGQSAPQTLTVFYPAPSITSVVPSLIPAGGPDDVTVVVNGSAFSESTQWTWNGGAVAALRYLSPEQVEIDVSPAQSANPGVGEIQALNLTPGPIGGPSNIATVSIGTGNPLPSVNSLSPPVVETGGPDFTLNVDGNGFVDSAVVRLAGADRPTTFVSSTRLQIDIDAAEIATADILQAQGQPPVSVRNPAPGGGESGPAVLVLSNPFPVASSLTPSSATAGDAGLTVSVTGADLLPNSVVLWNGAPRPSTYVSATELQAAISAADLASPGMAEVRVQTPAPAGGLTPPLTFTVAEPATAWVDDFERPAGADIGNGWIEKNPAAFVLANGTAQKQGVATRYRDNIVYRPASEDLTDVEASVQVQWTASIPGFAQVLARVQSPAMANGFNGYLLFIDDDPGAAVLGRQQGASLTTLATLSIAPALNTSDLFRLRLRVTGDAPVQVDAYVERRNGAAWDLIGQASVSDASAARILGPGTVAFGGHYFDGYGFDDFTRTDLGVSTPNPAPVATALAPPSTAAGFGDFTLTVTGSDFVPGSVVRFDGAERTTAYVSSTELQAVIQAADIAAPGSGEIRVFNPAPGGGTSGALVLDITESAPLASGVAPASAVAGDPDLVVTVDGDGFQPGASVRFNGAGRATAFLSRTQVQATLTQADLAAAQIAGLTVVNPGGLESTGVPFTVALPVPVIDTVSPAIVPLAAPGENVTITVTGTGFVAPVDLLMVGGDGETTPLGATLVSPTELRWTAADPAFETPGAIGFAAYVSPDAVIPGGGMSNVISVAVGAGNPPPALATIVPGTVTEGDPGFTLEVEGSGFVSGAAVRFNGASRPTTLLAPGRLAAQIPAGDIATAGSASVTVVNPAPGGGPSNALTLTIEPQPGNPLPQTSGLVPGSTLAGGAAFALTVAGADFVDGAVVRWNGSDRPTTFVSGGELSATITAPDIAAAGSATVTVFNPAPGGGGSNAQTFVINDGSGGTNPTPVLTGLAPLAATTGDPDQFVTVTGSGFDPASVVRWNGADRPTTFIAADTLQAVFPASDLQSASIASVTVWTPAPGGGSSAPHNFLVLDAGTAYFYDGFNRADDDVLGNGWTEKTPAAFAIVNNELGSANLSQRYLDSIVYRPAVEEVADVEIGMEFVRVPGDFQFPQVHARVQNDTVADPQTLESYIFFINDFMSPPAAVIARQYPLPGYYECVMSEVPLPDPPGLVVGDRYRLRFQVTGSNPVYMTGYVERFDAGAWSLVTQVSVVHDDATTVEPGLYCDPGFMPPPLSAAGTTGFSKWRDNTDLLDNYYWIELTGSVPQISSVTPVTKAAGATAFTLTVFGQNFTPESVVRWAGGDRPTTYVSDGELRADISAADIAAPASVDVTVFDPALAGSSSGPATIEVIGDNPAPALASLMPAQAGAGGPGFALTVLGSGFTPASVVRWNGVDRGTSFVSASELAASINAADLAVPGPVGVSVFTPAPGGGVSGTVDFTVTEGGSGGFFDDFERADGADIGNGWIEKNPAAFTLAGSRAVKQGVSSGFRDNVVYRPAAEDLADVEVALEFRISNSLPGYPQVLARIQAGTVAVPDTLEAYALFIDDSPSDAVLARIDGTRITELQSISLSPPLNTTDTYRLRLRATGSDPVLLSAYIEHLDGAVWEIMGQSLYQDAAAARIATPGSIGFGGYAYPGYSYDNVSGLNLGP